MPIQNTWLTTAFNGTQCDKSVLWCEGNDTNADGMVESSLMLSRVNAYSTFLAITLIF